MSKGSDIEKGKPELKAVEPKLKKKKNDMSKGDYCRHCHPEKYFLYKNLFECPVCFNCYCKDHLSSNSGICCSVCEEQFQEILGMFAFKILVGSMPEDDEPEWMQP